jgi:hypothetical protein
MKPREVFPNVLKGLTILSKYTPASFEAVPINQTASLSSAPEFCRQAYLAVEIESDTVTEEDVKTLNQCGWSEEYPYWTFYKC